MLYLFFFFKQKTAYEMRISDWSSDVCSSDLTLSSTLISISSSCLLAGFAAPVVISRLVGEAHEPVDRVRIHHRVAARGLFERPAEQQLAHRHLHLLAGQRVRDRCHRGVAVQQFGDPYLTDVLAAVAWTAGPRMPEMALVPDPIQDRR